MAISKNQRNDICLLAISAALILFLVGLWWAFDIYLIHRMTDICHSLNMSYYYKEIGTFYCISTNSTIRIQEIHYS